MKSVLTFKKIILVAIIFLAGWWIYRNYWQSADSTQYKTEVLERKNISATVTGSGSIRSSNATPITTLASGIVTKVYVQDGDTVRVQQPIALMEFDAVGQQQYAQASSSYQSAKIALSNAQANLYSLNSTMWSANQKFINDAVARGLATNDPTYIQQSSDWLAAENKYTSQLQTISQSRTALNSSYLTYLQSSPTIYAPISGKITGLSLIEGMVLASSPSSTQVAQVVNTTAPIVSLAVSEIDIGKIKKDNKATITLDAVSNKSFTARVISTDTVGSVTSGVTTYPVILQFENTAPEIFPHMSASVSIIVDSKENVVAAPLSSVVTTNNQTTIRTMQSDGSIKNIPVELGLTSDDYVEIVDGVSEGTQIVTSVITTNSSNTATKSVFSTPFGPRGR